jgi:hypothetical protein
VFAEIQCPYPTYYRTVPDIGDSLLKHLPQHSFVD